MLTGSTSLSGGAVCYPLSFYDGSFLARRHYAKMLVMLGWPVSAQQKALMRNVNYTISQLLVVILIRLYFDVLSVFLPRYLSRKVYDYSSCINKAKSTELIIW